MLNIAICDDEIDYVNSTADAVMKILSEYEVDISTYTSGIDLINNSTNNFSTFCCYGRRHQNQECCQ